MRILAVTNMYPTPEAPALGIFVHQQIKGLRQIGLEVEVAIVDRAQRGMRAYLGLGRKLRAWITDFQPAVVHVMYGGVMADQVTRIVQDRPTVVTFRGSDLLGEPLSGYLRKLIAGYGVWASQQAARRANGVVAVSKILQEILPEDVNRSKIRIIPSGIDLERFRPLNRDQCLHRLNWDANRFHILFASSSGNSVKRPGLAKAAVALLNQMGIHGEIHYLHGVPHNDVPIWLNASDVVLLTSLHEGSPNIVKEGLACNLPVVSVDVGDVRERIQGVEGCYLALPEPNDLAAKLALVHASPRRVAGRIKIQELSLESLALRLKAFYAEVLLLWKRENQPGCLKLT